MSTVGRIEVREFTRVGFLAAVKAAARRDDYETIDQVRYLQEYIGRDLQAATMVIERDYTDRHYIEEFAVYYSKLLTPPHSRTTRLHFFGDDLSPVAFEEALANAADGNHEDAQKAVNNAYLGFVVVRPLSTAPVGRTVLRFLATQDPERNFRPAEVTSTVHLCGFDLSVRGLPFQQQDQGVGACATTALWSMLAGAFRKNGQRPPLPTAITSAAHSLSYRNRRFPAVEGLNTEQMVAAIDQFGFAPEFFTVDRSGELFTAVVLCYLRSGFPVLLLVGDGSMDSGHAICVVGFSPNKAGDTNGVWSWSANDSDPAARLRYRGPRRFYLHDDRLGPYARCDFARGVLQSGDGGRTSYTECTIRIAVQMSQKDEIWAEKYAAPMA